MDIVVLALKEDLATGGLRGVEDGDGGTVRMVVWGVVRDLEGFGWVVGRFVWCLLVVFVVPVSSS